MVSPIFSLLQTHFLLWMFLKSPKVLNFTTPLILNTPTDPPHLTSRWPMWTLSCFPGLYSTTSYTLPLTILQSPHMWSVFLLSSPPCIPILSEWHHLHSDSHTKPLESLSLSPFPYLEEPANHLNSQKLLISTFPACSLQSTSLSLELLPEGSFHQKHTLGQVLFLFQILHQLFNCLQGENQTS